MTKRARRYRPVPGNWRPVEPQAVHGWALVATGTVRKAARWRFRKPDGTHGELQLKGGDAPVGRFERPCMSCARKVQIVVPLGAVEKAAKPPGEFGRRRCPWCIAAWRRGSSLRAAMAKARRSERDKARYRAKLAAKAANVVQ